MDSHPLPSEGRERDPGAERGRALGPPAGHREPAPGGARASGAPGLLTWPGRARRLWPWIPVLVYLVAIFHLSSQSNPLPELTSRFWDKGLHFVEYGTLGALLLFALRSSGAGRGLALLLAVVGASLYGASDEIHQAFVPGRSSDVLDWAADTLGGAMGAALLTLALRLARAPASIRRALGRG